MNSNNIKWVELTFSKKNTSSEDLKRIKQLVETLLLQNNISVLGVIAKFEW